MPFEGFLGDLRARPLRLRLLGYGTSLALHAPPLTAFVIAWLTRALVLENAIELPDYRRTHISYYEVPVEMVTGVPGVALARASGDPRLSAGDREGAGDRDGEGRRRTHRPLVFHQARKHERRPRATPPPVDVGPEEFAADERGPSALGDGVGHAAAGNGAGAGNGGDGGGGGVAGPGLGVSALARGAAGPADLAALLGSWIPVELRKKVSRPHDDDAGDPGGLLSGEVADDVAEVGPPLAGRPSRVSMNYAAYLRTYDPLPTLPESCWPPGRVTNTVLLEICVSEGGEVSDIVIRQSAGDDVDQYLTTAIKTWRYRPRVVQGTTQPFCHPIRLVYTRVQRFGSW